MRLLFLPLLLALGCAHMPAFMGPMCTPDPTVNDEKAIACLDFFAEDPDLRMCVYQASAGESYGTVYSAREGCWGDWGEVY